MKPHTAFLHTSLLLFPLAFPWTAARAVELVRLAPANWELFAPQGKERDAIYGDIVLRNSKLMVVIADTLPNRNANMTVRDVGGCVVDLTTRQAPNDQLSAYYPGGGLLKFHRPEQRRVLVDGQGAALADDVLRGADIELRLRATKGPCKAEVSYRVRDELDYVAVSTTYINDGDKPVLLPLQDSVRADRTFTFGVDQESGLFWADDQWFRQSYGIQTTRPVSHSGSRGIVVRYRKAPVALEPGQRLVVECRLLVGDHLAAVRGAARRLAGARVAPVVLTVTDPAGPVANALLEIRRADRVWATARSGGDGRLTLPLPHGNWQLKVTGQGRPPQQLTLEVAGPMQAAAKLPACGYVEATVTDERGDPLPCKVAFHGLEPTADPDYGPDSAAYGVGNLQYTANGRFRVEIAPGRYEVLISHGPEHDLVTKTIEVEQGRATKIAAALKRTVETPGWISADFHSHSSPSGDNTGSQRGRVLNLLAEHVEFAPCTEHNRISTYTPHLKELQAEMLMATCMGMELTGSPLVINHQNAFPLRRREHTQDGGGPRTDANPVVQIERLAMWDEGSDKLVQANHPNLVQIVGDKDQDGKYDGGFEQMLGFMDVVEVHPPGGIFTPPVKDPAGRKGRNPIFHWMQLLNLGRRIPGVVNTDAHYNFHGSGWMRNYLASPVDEPGRIDTMSVVQAAEAGHIVMTTGPYLEVSMNASDKDALPGDDLRAADGEASLRVRVQCPNWLDVNRVQVFLNGRPADELNFTRRTTPTQFSDGVVKYDRRIPLTLKQDTHVIVAVAGEGLALGRVMGPRYGQQMPVAVSNPIFVDVDGDGFQPNGDLLGLPLPHAEFKDH